MWLAENTGRKKVAKNRHLGTIAQLCQAIATKARIDNRKKKLVKQQYVLHMSPMNFGLLAGDRLNKLRVSSVESGTRA